MNYNLNSSPMNKVPQWQYTSYFDYKDNPFESANNSQREFYKLFKQSFHEGHLLDIEDNLPYAFILLFDLINEYKQHRDYNLLYTQMDKLSEVHPYVARCIWPKIDETVAEIKQEELFQSLKKLELSPDRQLCSWIDKGQSISIQGYEISRGLFYYGEAFLLPQKYYSDNIDYYDCKYIYASVIAPSLQVSNVDDNECVAFCTYQDMSPAYRYELLEFLSGEKSITDISEEVLLFYIYGWELRAFIDPLCNEKDISQIIESAINLYNEVRESSQRSRYVEKSLIRIIDAILAKYYPGLATDFIPKEMLCLLYYYNTATLYENIKDIKHINNQNIFDIAYNSNMLCDIPVKEYEYDIKKYIEKTFQQNIYIINVNHQDSLEVVQSLLPISCNSSIYRPEDVKLFATINVFDINIGNIKYRLSDFFNNLQLDFKKFKRCSLRTREASDSILSILNLPDYVDILNLSAISKFTADLINLIDDNEIIRLNVNDLISNFGFIIPNDKNMHLNDIECFENALRRLSYDIVPKIGREKKRLNYGDMCVLYKMKNNQIDYPLVQLIMKIISLVLQADTYTFNDINEIKKYLEIISSKFYNENYPIAYLQWLLFSKQSMDKKNKDAITNMLNDDMRSDLFDLLIRLSYSDKVYMKRLEALKKIVKLLGFQEEDIHSRLHRMQLKNNQLDNYLKTDESNLNSSILKEIEHQTRISEEILSNIFIDTNSSDINTAQTKHMDLLKMVKLLLKKEAWNKSEICNLCEHYGLLYGAFIEEINDYTFSCCEDILLEEEGDQFLVNTDIQDLFM